MSETGGNPGILIVDDDSAVRDSLEVMLSAKGFEVEAFDSGRGVLERIADLDQPKCVLLDIHMPGLDGLSVLRKLNSSGLPLRVIMITGQGDVPTAVRAMKEGASDFIEKPFSQAAILAAVAAACKALRGGEDIDFETRDISVRLSQLSSRERDVMERLVDGLTNKEIARDLNISPRTVEVYRAGVMEKMRAANLSSLVKMGLAVGLGTAH